MAWAAIARRLASRAKSPQTASGGRQSRPCEGAPSRARSTTTFSIYPSSENEQVELSRQLWDFLTPSSAGTQLCSQDRFKLPAIARHRGLQLSDQTIRSDGDWYLPYYKFTGAVFHQSGPRTAGDSERSRLRWQGELAQKFANSMRHKSKDKEVRIPVVQQEENARRLRQAREVALRMNWQPICQTESCVFTCNSLAGYGVIALQLESTLASGESTWVELMGGPLSHNLQQAPMRSVKGIVRRVEDARVCYGIFDIASDGFLKVVQGATVSFLPGDDSPGLHELGSLGLAANQEYKICRAALRVPRAPLAGQSWQGSRPGSVRRA